MTLLVRPVPCDFDGCPKPPLPICALEFHSTVAPVSCRAPATSKSFKKKHLTRIEVLDAHNAAIRRQAEAPFKDVKDKAQEQALLQFRDSPWCDRGSAGCVAMVTAVLQSDRAVRCTDAFLEHFADGFCAKLSHFEVGRFCRGTVLASAPLFGECLASDVLSVTALSLGQLPYNITPREVHGLLETFAPGSTMFVSTELSDNARRRGLWFAVVRTAYVAQVIEAMHHRVLFLSEAVLHLSAECSQASGGFAVVAEVLARRDALAVFASKHLPADANLHAKFSGGVWPMTVQSAGEIMQNRILPAEGRRIDYSTDMI